MKRGFFAALIVWVFVSPLILFGEGFSLGTSVSNGFSSEQSSPDLIKKTIDEIRKAGDRVASAAALTILYPYHQSIFPPDIVAPEFSWMGASEPHQLSASGPLSLSRELGPLDVRQTGASDTSAGPPIPPPLALKTVGSDSVWMLEFSFGGSSEKLRVLSASSTWVPEPDIWEFMKKACPEKPITLTITGVESLTKLQPLSRGGISFSISKDPVEAPIFFRDVPLPFLYAYNNMDLIKWRLGDISSPKPPRVVLENMSVCGNCHSFSADGKRMGMDVDYANDKGAYVVASVAEKIVFNKEKVISWNTFRPEDKEPTFGLLARISPDGRHILSTLKDLSVFVPVNDLCISQLFFPFKGILVSYNVDEKTFKPLTGADDPQYVQTNPTWSPDGKTVVFARSKTGMDLLPKLKIKNFETVLKPEDIADFVRTGRIFQYDLYRISYNNGNGGKPEMIQGAGQNGMSNYFPKISPDGRWIVFTQAKSFMLLQQDSQLYIIPAEGGTPRRMNCNLSRMNSWHSWSPNGHWMVFSSKHNTPYTQLFLTHIDEKGMDAPPVLLRNFTEANRAANIPEFVNVPNDYIQAIDEQYIDEYSHYRMAQDYLYHSLLPDKAEKEALKSLAKKPDYLEAQSFLGIIYEKQGEFAKAEKAFLRGVEIASGNPQAYGHLAVYYDNRGDIEKAEKNFEICENMAPKSIMIKSQFAMTLQKWGKFDKAQKKFEDMVAIDPNEADTYGQLATFLQSRQKFDEALQVMNKANQLKPNNSDILQNIGSLHVLRKDLDAAEKVFLEAAKVASQPAKAYLFLGTLYLEKKDPKKAEAAYNKAIELDPDNMEAYFMLSSFQQSQGQDVEARKTLETAIKIHPDFTDAHLQLGKFHMRRNDFRLAEEAFKGALKTSSDTGAIDILLGSLYSQNNDNANAENSFRKALREKLEDAESSYVLGNFLFKSGKLDEAQKHLERSIALDPRRMSSYLELGKLFGRKGDLTKAEENLHKALGLASNSTELYSLLGQLYLQKKDSASAVLAFQKAIDLDPQNSQLHFSIASKYAELPETLPEAIRFQDAGLRLAPEIASGWFALGTYYLQTRNPDKALPAFEESSRRQPGNASLSAMISDLHSSTNLRKLVIGITVVWIAFLIIFALIYRDPRKKSDSTPEPSLPVGR